MKFILSVVDSGPLSLRARRELSGAETRGYIPGATVLGALAAAHAAHRGDPAEFNGFFGPDSRFGNLYPASFDNENLYKDAASPILPLPATAVSCKRFSGFRCDQKPDEGEVHHGVYDTAMASTLFALSGGRKIALLDQFNHCKDDTSRCREPMDRFEGFYRWRGSAVGRTQASRGLRTRAGISRLTGAVEQGILYSREVLNAGTAYWGAADVPKPWARKFEDFVGEFSEAGLLRFGNNRTRGFGRAQVEAIRQDDDAESVKPLMARMAEFDRRLRAQAKAEHIDASHDLYVTITLTSEAVLLDRLLRFQTRIDGAYLDAQWQIPGAELLFQSGGTRRVMGWNQALGVPKGDETAVTMGSVFVFGLNRPLDEGIAAKFLAMQQQGIGVRRREGFGELVVASPFHYEMRGL